MENNSYLYTGKSTDISFCLSGCSRTECKRNINGVFYKKYSSSLPDYEVSTYCDYGYYCSDFKEQ